MAYFAELDETNMVIDVKVVSNDALDSSNEEQSGVAFLTSLFGQKVWKQTSYNGRIRYNYAGVFHTYDPIDDAFIAPMPDCGHETLLLNDKKRWECSACDELAKAL
jgi:hypothetical protein